MIENLVMLASYGYVFGGEVGSLLAQLEQFGFFSYVLPFLILFSLVFGVLDRTKIFNNKGINGIIALSIGLMALQFDLVPRFFAELFPRFGIGLSIILVILILASLFVDPDNKPVMVVFLGIAVVILVVILAQTGLVFGSGIAFWLRDNVGLVVFLVVLVIIIGIMFSSSESKPFSSGLSKILKKIE
ncbi:hypothetical protein HN832_00670 [archaeon]|jgi:hypothetical protein|nr:hypothetical protein [archaeon]MBT4373865.1 hypothetical protein [archaeon]MBT4532387.1 hypothetical protein [archaeon]MBT7001768.1 hypothetical protein [archaeon]MBT7281907.1 hypothetical protein [archaeon]